MLVLRCNVGRTSGTKVFEPSLVRMKISQQARVKWSESISWNQVLEKDRVPRPVLDPWT